VNFKGFTYYELRCISHEEPEPHARDCGSSRSTGMCQLSFLTQLPFSFFSYLFSTALQATRWARSSSPY
jgi:hypothetical protein